MRPESRRSGTGSEPFYLPYLRRLGGNRIARTVAKMGLDKTKTGRYRVVDRHYLPSVARTVASAKTRELAIRRAIEAVRRENELLVCQLIFERHVLLRGLQFDEVAGSWYMPGREFRRLMSRIAHRRLAIYGIEAWTRKRRVGRVSYNFHDVRIFELDPHKRQAKDPRWYRNAFRELSHERKDLWFSCSVDISPKLIGFDGRR